MDRLCPIFRVNHAFKGVLVEKPGTYIVTFGYWPEQFAVSLSAFGIGLFLLFVWMVSWWKPGVKEKASGNG